MVPLELRRVGIRGGGDFRDAYDGRRIGVTVIEEHRIARLHRPHEIPGLVVPHTIPTGRAFRRARQVVN